MIYILMLIFSRIPNLAEDVLDDQLQDSISYSITFDHDGWDEHYYVERYNQSNYGTIVVKYTRSSNTLEVDVSNIEELIIDCRSMFEEKSEEVFGVPYSENSNYYKWYFIDKNHLNVNVDSDEKIKNLTFKDTPLPYEVRVNGELWVEDINYFFKQDYGIVISNVPEGHSNVDVYFQSPETKVPIAKISSDQDTIYCKEPVGLSGEGSYDPDGQSLQYFWDFGDGTFITGNKTVSHSYGSEGVYGVILTVRDEDQLISHAYLNITVLNRTIFSLKGIIPDQVREEDSGAWELDLKLYEPLINETESAFNWYATGEDDKLFALEGENSTNNIFIFNPLKNAFGYDSIRLWMTNDDGKLLYQDIWVNITPVNDPPSIIDAPDITVHYDVDYTFDYEPYIVDVDTPVSELVLSSSDSLHASINGLKITYNYPIDFVDNNDNFIVLTISDGKNNGQKLIKVNVIDGSIPGLIKGLPDIELYEGETRYHIFDLKDYFTPMDDSVDIKLIGLDNVAVIIHENYSLTAKAPHDWTGSEDLTIRVIVKSGAIIEDTMKIMIMEINDPPQISIIPDLIIYFDHDYYFDLRSYVFDEDDPLDSMKITVSNNKNIRIDGKNPQTIILNYPWQVDLPYTVFEEITVSDGVNSASREVTIIVSDNHPPTLIKPIPDFAFYEDTVLENAFNIFNYFIDADGDKIQYNISTEIIIVEISDSGVVTLSAPENWNGKRTVWVTATDDAELSAFYSTSFGVYVIPVNDPPVLKDIPQVNLNLSETARIDLTEYLFDIDNDLSELNLTLNSSMVDVKLFGYDLIIFGGSAVTGKFDVNISDGEESDSQIVLVSVRDTRLGRVDFGPFLLVITLSFIMFITAGVLLAVRRHYGNYKIIETYLIYENGCLIKYTTTDKNSRDIGEVDLVGSMFTAVQDFIQDSFSNGKDTGKKWSLNRMEFGENNILIERGDHIFLAVIFSGTAGTKLIASAKDTITSIEKDYTSDVMDWNGDISIFKDLKIELK